jgi:hypothetical protein
MDVRRQIFCRIDQPEKSLQAHARGRITRPLRQRNLLIPGAFVVGSDNLLDLRIADYQEPSALHVSATLRASNSPSKEVGLSMKLSLSIYGLSLIPKP